MTSFALRRLMATTVLLAAGAAALQGGTSRGAASCILGATYLQAPYFGVGSIAAADVGGEVGPGTIPACNDTPGSGIVEQPTPVTLLRVRGVAPRFAVALPGGSGASASLIVADGSPCFRSTVAQSLGCLRQRTAQLMAGPALIAYPSARTGDVIQLGVYVRDPSLRRRVIYGAAALLQRRDGDRWTSAYHLPYALPGERTPPAPVPVGTTFGIRDIALIAGQSRIVLLPTVDPGQYRIAQQVIVGSRRVWLFASLTILEPPPSRCANCPHG